MGGCASRPDLSAQTELLESPSKRSRLSHARADESDAPFTLWTPRSDGTTLPGKPISMLHDENRAEEVLVLDEDDDRAHRPTGGMRSPPWSPTRVFNLGPLTPSRSPLHGGRSPLEPLPELLCRNSASPQPRGMQQSVERCSSAERSVKDLLTAVDSAAARTPSPVRQLLEVARSTAAAAQTHQPVPTSHVTQQLRPLPRNTRKPQLPAVLGRRPRQPPERTNSSHASIVPADEPQRWTRRTSTRPSLAAARTSVSLRSGAPEPLREKAAEKMHTTPRSHDRRPSPLELPGSILTPSPVTSATTSTTTTSAALIKSPAPATPKLPRLPEPRRQPSVKQTTSALQLLKKNKRNRTVLQPLPEPVTATAHPTPCGVHAALERVDSAPPATLKPLTAVAPEQAEPHPFTSAPFPSEHNPTCTRSGGDEGGGGGAPHGMKARLNKLKKRSSSTRASALQLQKLVPSDAAATAAAAETSDATGVETQRAFGDAEADGASEVIYPGVQRRKMPRGFDRPLSPPSHPQYEASPRSRPLSRVSRPSSQSAPRAAALSVEQQRLLQQRRAEVELLLRLDVASAPARVIASHQVKQLDTFLQTLHELARCAAMEPQAVHSHLCQQHDGHSAMDRSLRRQSGMDLMATAETHATLKRAASHSKTLPEEVQALSHEELLQSLVRGAQLLRQIVAIKVQDNNDLRTAHKAVQDALEFFSLAALSDACSV